MYVLQIDVQYNTYRALFSLFKCVQCMHHMYGNLQSICFCTNTAWKFPNFSVSIFSLRGRVLSILLFGQQKNNYR